MHVSAKKDRNIENASRLIAQAAVRQDAEIVGLPELFSTPFFPIYRDKANFKLAEPIPGPTTLKMCKIAKEFGIFLLVPIFEREKQTYFDSSAVISPDGEPMGVYRKSSVPETVWSSDGVVNHEKYYFSRGDGFKVVELGNLCKLGLLICYDRHYPEAWRTLKRLGAEVVYVPNASIGTTISDMFTIETRVMSKVNRVFGVVSNRIGMQDEFSFFGQTHMIDPCGRLIAGPENRENVIVASLFDLSSLRKDAPLSRSSNT